MEYLTADPHLEHEGVRAMSCRKFATMAEHDDYVIAGINRTVMPNDTLRVLGDFSWRAALSYREKINCGHVHLIWGNHDRTSYSKAFKTVELGCFVKIGGIDAWLSHYPHCFWPKSHYGSFHFYGHLHNEREACLDKIWPTRRSQDVGIDTAKVLLGDYVPFSEEWLHDRHIKREGHDPVAFYRCRQWLRNVSCGFFVSRQAACENFVSEKLDWGAFEQYTETPKAEALRRLEYLPGGCFGPNVDQEQVDK